MTECNSHETHNLGVSLSDQQQFRLNKINEIKVYFVAEIKNRELISKILSKYISSLFFFDKSFIVLSVATGSISIAFFATVIGTSFAMLFLLLGKVSASFSLAFFISTGIVKQLLKTTRNKKEKTQQN